MWHNGLFDLSWPWLLVYFLCATHLTIVSVTLYLHRCQAHRGVDLHPLVSHGFRFWLWLTTGMVTKEWVAIHRKHHARCETEEDPHSPQVKGIKTVFWQGAELYREAAKNVDDMERFGHGTPDDWLERQVYAKHNVLGISVLLILNFALFGWLGITAWAIQMIWIPFWAAGVINGLGHFFGYRNYEPKDASTNLSPIGIWIGGEELHNNHHAFPSSAKFSSRRWEFDIGWMYINVLSTMGLARVKRVALAPKIDQAKRVVDMETLTAVARHRVHVMADYVKTVIKPSYQAEKLAAGEQWRQRLKGLRRLMVRDESLLDEGKKARLSVLLSTNERLALIYEYKQSLQQLFNSRELNQQKLLEALKDWCAKAEASGVVYLQQFASQLKGYRLVPVVA